MSPRLKREPVLECVSLEEWEEWLAQNHASASEVWLRLAKKGSRAVTVTRAEALEVALCYGWIDGQAASESEEYWLQRFTPRTRRSKWSRINCEAVEGLTRAGRMKPAGLDAVASAKADGRWQAAYAPPSRMEVPQALIEALRLNPKAEAFFAQLDAQNRYAILYRIHNAKKPETKTRRIAQFVEMLARGEKIH
jgi:uncharacterized protein YdeI (YjbR/CyaY-like superfamily)